MIQILEKLDVKDYVKDKNLMFERLLLKSDESILVEVSNASVNPPTEIEDCLDSCLFFHTLQEFCEEYEELQDLFSKKKFQDAEVYSANFFDLTRNEQKSIKDFFDDKEGYNKIVFAKKYVELMQYPFFESRRELKWINEIKGKMNIL